MRLARRAFLTSMMSAVAGPAVLRVARAAPSPITLKLHHSFSAVSGAHEKFLAPWARKIEAQSGGRLRVDIFPSMQLGGAPAQLFDQARDGFVDIVWAAPGTTPGRFAKAEAFELPFLPSRRALVNSMALQDFAAVHLRDEFSEVHPICFSCRDHGVLHADRAVASIADLRGLRLHVPNQVADEAVRALGARGVSVPMPQVPMAVTGHAIDGCLVPWDAVPALRLHDLLKQHTDFGESALSTSTFVLAMNNAAYERLPAELKSVIDDNSGREVARLAGAMWDVEAKTVADMVRERGDPVTVLSADDVAQWRAVTEPVVTRWVRQMKERKIDGGKLIARIHGLIGKYASEPTPQTSQAVQPPRPTEQQVVAEPPKSSQPPEASQASQAAVEMTRPKADAPAAVSSTPVVRTRVPKELDIPL
jgi:TRAP-type transport system periplasmic protein